MKYRVYRAGQRYSLFRDRRPAIVKNNSLPESTVTDILRLTASQIRRSSNEPTKCNSASRHKTHLPFHLTKRPRTYSKISNLGNIFYLPILSILYLGSSSRDTITMVTRKRRFPQRDRNPRLKAPN